MMFPFFDKGNAWRLPVDRLAGSGLAGSGRGGGRITPPINKT